MVKNKRLLIYKIILGIFIILIAALYLPTQPPIPKIARDLPTEERNKVFTDRVKNAFPLNTPEENMKNDLREQGFKINDKNNFAIFSKSPHFLCEFRWIIEWQAKDGLITSITAYYGDRCV